MDHIKNLREILGSTALLSEEQDLQAYGRDWIKDYTPEPLCIALPESREQVQAVLRYCYEQQLAVVPSGGRSGLSGGATACRKEVILALDKLNKFIEVNPIDRTITCDAGVITQKVQETASANGLYFPIDFASKGSSQIGGNVATNAGGIRVIKYGNIRDWVLGLEAVLPDGRLLELNGSLFKNNTGYDLKSLLIASEGTLAVITRVTLRLTQEPKDLVRVLCGLNSLDGVLEFLKALRTEVSEVSAFEFFPRIGLDKVINHHKLRDPFPDAYPFYVVAEVENCNDTLKEQLEEFLCSLMESETLAYVVISQSHKHREELLAFRELLPETLSSMHTLHKNDISVPVPAIPEFLNDLTAAINREYPDYEVVTFGHIGDGNLHINILKPAALSDADFFARSKQADTCIFEAVRKYRGSISAEHGVGIKKKQVLNFSRSETEIELMRGIKKVFDPKAILNPGKIFDL